MDLSRPTSVFCSETASLEFALQLLMGRVCCDYVTFEGATAVWPGHALQGVDLTDQAIQKC